MELLRRDAADPDSSRDFGKDFIPYVVKNGKAVAHRFAQSCVRSTLSASLLARRGHDRRLLAGQYRPDRHRPGARSLRQVLADLDLFRDHPPAKFVHDDEGRRGRRSLRWFRATASYPVRLSTRACCSPASVQFLFPPRRRCRSAEGADRPSCAVSQMSWIDHGVVIPEGLIVGEDPEMDAKRFRRSGKRDLPHHTVDDRQTGLATSMKVLSVASELYPLIKPEASPTSRARFPSRSPPMASRPRRSSRLSGGDEGGQEAEEGLRVRFAAQ